MQDTISYFRIILIGSTVTVCNNFAMTLLRCGEIAESRSFAMILSSIINVILDVLFVFRGNGSIRRCSLQLFWYRCFLCCNCYLYIRRIKELQFTAIRLENQNEYCKVSHA